MLKLEKHLYPLRYMGLAGVIASFFAAALMCVIGIAKTVRAFAVYFRQGVAPSSPMSPKAANFAMAYLIQAIDAFLIALVFLLFSYGVYTLFIRKIDAAKFGVLSWINIENISQLKNILAELVIIILFVKFLEAALLNLEALSWEMLILPISTLLLALALKFLELKKK